MHNFLSLFDIKYKIYIVEQKDDKPFNRAKLLNIGFNETYRNHDYFCFHDVDMLPVNRDCDYSYTESACRLSHFVSQFAFVPRPENEFGGGVIMINNESFLRVNGFSNEYWGWGVEDNDFSERCKRKNINIFFRKGRYMSLAHEANGDTNGKPPSPSTVKNRQYFSEIVNKDTFFDSGLKNLVYSVLGKEEQDGYSKIVVKL
jgi:predicted glycosyltransferase involved in capsule biosynthesis